MRQTLRVMSILLATALAQLPAQQRDTVPSTTLFTWRDAVLGAVFIGGTYALHPVDKAWAQRLQNPRNQQNRFLEKVATGFRTIADPGALIIGASLYTIGRVSKDDRL